VAKNIIIAFAPTGKAGEGKQMTIGSVAPYTLFLVYGLFDWVYPIVFKARESARTEPGTAGNDAHQPSF
jgi:hypothetical protein